MQVNSVLVVDEGRPARAGSKSSGDSAYSSGLNQRDQLFDCFALHGRKNRAVYVECDSDARVSEAFLNDLGVDAGTKQGCGM